MADRFREQEELERAQKDKEAAGWDLKFQNYWGYIKQAGNKMNQSLPMCEKLFKHVGEFRKHTTQIAMDIVDEMHKPGISKFGQKLGRKMEPIEMMRKITEKGFNVYMDEEDTSLYFSGS